MNPPSMDDDSNSVSPISGSTGSGQFAGVMIAKIKENKDSTNQGRVQLELPWLPNVEPWARVAAMSGGGKTGTYFIPQVGEEVLVAFQQGDPRSAYVIGSLWNGKDLPPSKTPLDPVNRRLIRTPAGHELEFDDQKKSVTLESTTGHKVVMKPESVEISAKGGGASIVLNADGSITISGTTIKLTGKTKITLDAPIVEVNGKGQAKLTSGGVCEIQAPMVKIN